MRVNTSRAVAACTRATSPHMEFRASGIAAPTMWLIPVTLRAVAELLGVDEKGTELRKRRGLVDLKLGVIALIRGGGVFVHRTVLHLQPQASMCTQEPTLRTFRN